MQTCGGAGGARVSRGGGFLVRDRAAAAGATLKLHTPVQQVRQQADGCTVTAENGETRQAKLVICALPLGVLQRLPRLFNPRPEEALRAAAALRAGAVERTVYQFRERWWAGQYPGMHFLLAQGSAPPTWWTTAPIESPLLTGWAGGPRARREISAEAIAQEGLDTLERLFHHSVRDQFVAAHFHDWQRDRYALGAYSYAPAGAAEASAILTEPVGGTLLFAGEHTDTTGHPGTVHGALRSGLRAGEQALTLLAARS